LIRSVFFDLGGTLLIMRRDRVLQRVLQDEGYSVELKRIRASYEEMEPGWLEYYAGHHATGSAAVEAYRRLNALVIKNLGITKSAKEAERLSNLARDRREEISSSIPVELYPDAEPALSKLTSLGLTLALVSNAPPDTSQTVDELGLSRYIKHIVISGIVGYSKPNPQIFRIALSRASANAKETIHVGDVYASDVVGARNAGIRAVLLDREGTSGAKDCERIRSLAELPTLLTAPATG
jgi:putative hydrolase of the HAD superfamily